MKNSKRYERITSTISKINQLVNVDDHKKVDNKVLIGHFSEAYNQINILQKTDPGTSLSFFRELLGMVNQVIANILNIVNPDDLTEQEKAVLSAIKATI